MHAFSYILIANNFYSIFHTIVSYMHFGWRVQCQHQILLVQKESKTFAMIVSLYLHVFSHRQLYVAFYSRVDSGWVTQKLGSHGLLLIDQMVLSANYVILMWPGFLIDHIYANKFCFHIITVYIIGCAFCTGLTIRYIYIYIYIYMILFMPIECEVCTELPVQMIASNKFASDNLTNYCG